MGERGTLGNADAGKQQLDSLVLLNSIKLQQQQFNRYPFAGGLAREGLNLVCLRYNGQIHMNYRIWINKSIGNGQNSTRKICNTPAGQRLPGHASIT